MSQRNYREWNVDCKVYIGNLSDSCSKNEVETSFSKYGPLKNVWVARNPPGFAFVEFEDPRDAEDAVRGLDGTRISGSRVRVEMSHGRRRNRGQHNSGGYGRSRHNDWDRDGADGGRNRDYRDRGSYRGRSRSRSR
ncbi:RNA-binding protein 1-like protein [Leptotrombidium deliense]|uniref:RNA-binding protein 1-like protein n=1 Tax=Leptotrombidium deliense TaxID=299467 RepID=A0A443S309_9ACAR|nr:RNA-binding protein 1-like protein [Leptotrombidium deliense]